jgi:hypothetical protein
VLRLTLAFVDIMLHRRGPDSLPSAAFLFWLLLSLALASGVAVNVLAAGLTTAIVAVALLVVGLELWFVWAMLRVFGRERRFRQTMSAVLGTNLVISVLVTPFIPFAEPPTPTDQTLSLAWLALFFLKVWSIDITSFVLSRALERPYLLALAIVIAYVLLIETLQQTLLSSSVA